MHASIRALLEFFEDVEQHPESFAPTLNRYFMLANEIACIGDHTEVTVALRQLLQSRDSALRGLRALAERDTVPIEPIRGDD